MIVRPTSIFTMSDKNGYRKDIVQAYREYLSILDDINTLYPQEPWGKYPVSVRPYMFYAETIKRLERFKDHIFFDEINVKISDNFNGFIYRDEKTLKQIGLFPFEAQNEYYQNYLLNIDRRAVCFTNSLLKIGFIDEDRFITEAGRHFLDQDAMRDAIENKLPIDDESLILFRQLLKLKIYTKKDINDNYNYYCPTLLAIKLLLENKSISKEEFVLTIMSTNPYDKYVKDIDFLQIGEGLLDKEDFYKYFEHNDILYSFYCNLYKFVNTRRNSLYIRLSDIYFNNKTLINNSLLLNKVNPLLFGNQNRRFDKATFVDKNTDYWFNIEGFNQRFYHNYEKAKLQKIYNESDNYFTLLSSTGLIDINESVKLLYPEQIKEMFKDFNFDKRIFGTSKVYNEYDWFSSFSRDLKCAEII